ncbi:Methylenetetrahydrofolate dehydrogenase [NAD(+)] [Symbiodinium microadriaticum]|uniref:Methylenetetrahydrofolate dehydrogenase [NAD(+)] n=1 Tax=Symbiodinium microadriaticum TaxID=2951 RepID=A0A1Q9EAI8_SYMMI|nr:Methylenetetrahydrofolate dehydrogenase [NAD(+)] [Symbiodinium microadriaticum]
MADAPELAAGARKVLADEVAAPFREEIRKAVADMGGVGPKLVGFLANADPAAKKYAEWTGKAMTADNLRFELRQVEEGSLEDELEKANKEPDVDGIMIYYPVFGQRPSFHGGSHDDYLRDTVSPYKDAEGLNHFYRRALYRNKRSVDSAGSKKCVLPCTPLAVVKTLEHLQMYDPHLPVGERMTGKTAVVVNRSEVVGRPVAAMLANDGAKVWSVDIDSLYIFTRGKLVLPSTDTTVEAAVKEADIVILGVPSDKYKMDPSWIKEGAVVINVATTKNIDEKVLLATRPGVRYMGQIGKVTVAMLERNLLRLHQNFKEQDRCIVLDAERFVEGRLTALSYSICMIISEAVKPDASAGPFPRNAILFSRAGGLNTKMVRLTSTSRSICPCASEADMSSRATTLALRLQTDTSVHKVMDAPTKHDSSDFLRHCEAVFKLLKLSKDEKLAAVVAVLAEELLDGFDFSKFPNTQKQAEQLCVAWSMKERVETSTSTESGSSFLFSSF